MSSDLKMPDTNTVIIAGRLTRDPELAYTANEKAYCRLGIANGRDDRAVFVDVVCWEKTAEWMAQNVQKGRPVMIEGRLNFSQWEDKDTGKKRSKVEITAHRVNTLDWDSDGGGGGEKPVDDRPF